MFCKKCGSEMSDGAKFCTNCGAKLEGGQAIVSNGETNEDLKNVNLKAENNEGRTAESNANVSNGQSNAQGATGGSYYGQGTPENATSGTSNGQSTSGNVTSGQSASGNNAGGSYYGQGTPVNDNMYDAQSYAQRKKKSGGKAKYAIMGGLVVALLLVVIAIFTPDPDSDKYIELVKSGYPVVYEDCDVDYGEAFDFFFADAKWKYFVSDDDKKVVEFSGKCSYGGENVNALIQFIVDDDGESFERYYGSIDDEKYDEDEIINAAFDDYIEHKK